MHAAGEKSRMTRLHMFRHGQSVWNILGRLQGQQDSPLTDLGYGQAQDAARELAGEDIWAAYSSTSSRAVTTTQILLGDRNLPIHQMDQLRKIDLGAWEGEHKEEVRRRFPAEYQAFWEHPEQYQSVDGETFHELQARAVEAILGILKDNRGHTVLLVSHGAFIKATLCFFEGRPLHTLWEPPFPENLSHSIIAEGDSRRWEVMLHCQGKRAGRQLNGSRCDECESGEVE